MLMRLTKWIFLAAVLLPAASAFALEAPTQYRQGYNEVWADNRTIPANYDDVLYLTTFFALREGR